MGKGREYIILGPFFFFPPAHLFHNEKMLTRDCWIGTGVSIWGFKGVVGTVSVSLDTFPLVLCCLTAIH